MGKIGEQSRQQQRYDEEQALHNNSSSSEILCQPCSLVIARLRKDLSFKCFFVLLLSLAILVYGIFSIVPFRPKSGFDAQESFKLTASAQAYFLLEKPVSELIPRMERLQYDINAEIGVPDTKVVILSMHEADTPNLTAVVFGALSDPITAPINLVSLSLMKSSLVEVFMNQTNLTLTTGIFGEPSKFEILRFQGGITVIPKDSPIWVVPQILFNFTLNNSISEILENIGEFRDQLKFGLRLRTDEIIFVRITSTVGSTKVAPVVIEASIWSNSGILDPQRLRQLAETLTDSPSLNLGLNHTLFGKVKSISLSSYLNGTLSPPISPSPSPAPAPAPIDHFGPSISPGPASRASPPHTLGPQPCPYLVPEISPSPYNPIAPSASSPQLLPMDPKYQLSPGPTPAPRGSRYSSLSPAPSPSAANPLYKPMWSMGIAALIVFHLLCWSY